MAAPSAPTGWQWLEDTTANTDNLIQVRGSKTTIFVDSVGNLLAIIGGAAGADIRVWYSDDNGDSWTFANTVSRTGSTENRFQAAYDPIEDVLFLTGDTSSGDGYLNVCEWDASLKTMTNKANLQYDSGANFNWCYDMICGSDSGTVYLAMIYEDDGSPKILTCTYVPSTDTLTEVASSTQSLPGGDVSDGMGLATKNGLHYLENPLTDPIYGLVGGTSGTLGRFRATWNGTNGYFTIDAQNVDTISGSVVHIMAQPVWADSKWWIVNYENGDIKVWKADDTQAHLEDVTGWTKVFDLETDVTEITAINPDPTVAFCFDVSDETEYIWVSATDDEVWIVQYDLAADTYTATDTNLSTVINSIYGDPVSGASNPDKGLIAFMAELQTTSGTGDDFAGVWLVKAPAGAAARVGWGWVPIGG